MFVALEISVLIYNSHQDQVKLFRRFKEQIIVENHPWPKGSKPHKDKTGNRFFFFFRYVAGKGKEKFDIF